MVNTTTVRMKTTAANLPWFGRIDYEVTQGQWGRSLMIVMSPAPGLTLWAEATRHGWRAWGFAGDVKLALTPVAQVSTPFGARVPTPLEALQPEVHSEIPPGTYVTMTLPNGDVKIVEGVFAGRLLRDNATADMLRDAARREVAPTAHQGAQDASDALVEVTRANPRDLIMLREGAPVRPWFEFEAEK